MVVAKVWGNFELPGLGVWELDSVWRTLKLSTILRVVGDMTQFVPLESRDLNSKNLILDKEMLLIFS